MMMYPSFRGGNQNSGVKEAFLGEVDDVLASADFLAKQPGVDPNRIYLGGHSTGGTMVLLAAECSSRFRAVFSFGPMADVSSYGQEYLPFDVNDKTEVRLRSPGYWLESIECPTFVFTGTVQDNTTSVKWMMKYGKNPKVECHLVEGANHHSILAPLTKLVAEKILNDTGPSASFSFDDGQLNALFAN